MATQATGETEPERVTEAMLRERWGLVVKAEFVPFSRSRHAGEKNLTLNWRVTLCKVRETYCTEHGRITPCDSCPKCGNAVGVKSREPRAILTTDYSAGIAHCPSYAPRMTTDVDAAVKLECEKGRAVKRLSLGIYGAPILPDAADVVHSLVLDSDVIDHPTYEDWASDYGYDVDSRKGEATYRACLEIALKLRAGVGEAVLAELREAFDGY